MNMQLTGELNELESAICCVNGLAEAEQRTSDPRELRQIRLAMIESLRSMMFLANDIRRQLNISMGGMHHVH